DWSWDALAVLPAEANTAPLQAGQIEFGLQSGYLRLDRGTPNARYAADPLVSAGIRYGASHHLTLESYAEATQAMHSQGAGLVTRLGRFGTLGLSANFSEYEQIDGRQWMALYSGDIGNVRYFAGIQQRTPGYF